MTQTAEKFIVENDLDIQHNDVNDNFFARTIGAIEDIILSDEFLTVHTNFLENNWHYFDDSQENKLIYTDLFNEYCKLIEDFIDQKLTEKINGFKWEDFELELRKRKDELDGEIFDILETFSDFLSFKEQLLDYKAMKEGRAVDVTQDLLVKKL